jgi:hypothetical protein
MHYNVHHFPKQRRACSGNCPCANPKNWRRQSISLPCLEELEIDGLTGEDHEIDFLGVISKCSPMLKRVTVKLACTFGDCSTKIYNCFVAYPSVNCHVYSSSGNLVEHASG